MENAGPHSATQHDRHGFNVQKIRLRPPQASPTLRTHMMDSVFFVESIREKHRKAPLLVERERYLAYLFEIGTQRERVRYVATMLLHIVRLLELDSPRLVGIDEILQGSKRWVDDPGAYRHRSAAEASAYTFQLVATNWLRYQGSLIVAPKPKPCFHNLLSQFLNDMHSQRG